MKFPTEAEARSADLNSEGDDEHAPANGAGNEARGGSNQDSAATLPVGSVDFTSRPQAQGADFSEFLWMEHEAEYDQQVLRELEEEDMINYYIDMYEDSLEAEMNGRHFPQEHAFGSAAPSGNFGAVNRGTGVGSGEDLSQTLSRILTFPSTLNPNAVEFVPRQSTVQAEPRNTTEDSRAS